MIRPLKNMDTAFRQMRVFSLLFLAGCLLISGFVVHQSFRVQAAAQDRIYVLANGRALEALAAGRKDNIPVEARDHVRSFHACFFTLDPDEAVIEENMNRAFYLADASAKQQYDNLKENGYYAGIIAGNISQEIEADSIYINTEVYPYFFRYAGRQRIIRPATIATRSLVTEGYLRNVSRSDHNPHGFLIEKWRTVENRDLKLENR